MKNKFFLWLSLLIVLSSTLQSCRNEDLLLSDKKENQKSTSSKILHYQDLVKNKAVFGELMKITKNDNSQTSKLYVDEENGFTVDLDDCLFMEDPKGQKSYTFKITEIDPKNNNPDILENLVLVEKGEGLFESYIFQYERDVQLNYFKSEEDLIQNLKQKVKVFGLGEKRNIDINSKIALCVGVTATYVEQPGTACASGQHSYEDGSACAYWGTTDMALPGYGGHFVYTFNAADCYGGGGGNPSSGSGTTGPYHGGGSGTGTINNPCIKTKNMLTRPNVQQGISDVKTQAEKAANDVNEGEIGRIEINDGTILPANVSADHHVTFNDISGTKGIYHNHTFNGAKIHSPPDIASILAFASVQPSVTNYGDAYVGMIGADKCVSTVPNCFKMRHYLIRFIGTVSDLTISFTADQMIRFKKDSRDREHELAEKLPYVDFLGDELNNKGLEKLFFDTLANMGLSGKVMLQRVDDDGTVNNINLDASGVPVAIPCP
ncbi:hypothetical protein [Chryseobacterium tongliaoense]|uniref:hypothetical protein n=1 Tax=Chryseobacterium tongliaoense TaxID=3240933 RepID=UPI003517A7A5